MEKVLPLLLKVKAGALLFETANPVARVAGLAGCPPATIWWRIDSTTNYSERRGSHPALPIVGRERVIRDRLRVRDLCPVWSMPRSSSRSSSARGGAGSRAKTVLESSFQTEASVSSPSWSAEADHPRVFKESKTKRGWSAFADHDGKMAGRFQPKQTRSSARRQSGPSCATGRRGRDMIGAVPAVEAGSGREQALAHRALRVSRCQT